MKLHVNNQIKVLGLAFFFIFLGFNAVQQYVTTFFSGIGLPDLGFHSLILVYLFFTLSDPLSSVVVSKIGAKKCMAFASFFYFLFIVLLLSQSPILIYIGSAALGIAASLLWTGQNSYLIRVSNKKNYGSNSGFFYSLLFLGSALGVVALGFISSASFVAPFLIFSVFPIIAMFLLFTVKGVQAQKGINHFSLVKKSVASVTALRLSSLWFVMEFISGLVVGIIPLAVKNVLGVSYIGILSSLFFIMPVLLSYFFGRASDIKGRKFMIVSSYGLLVLGLLFLFFSSSAIFLVIGIVLFSVVLAILVPIKDALVGDIATKKNLEFLVALFWMIRNIGVVTALLLSQTLQSNTQLLYLSSIGVALVSFVLIAPVLKLKTEDIRKRLAVEIGDGTREE